MTLRLLSVVTLLLLSAYAAAAQPKTMDELIEEHVLLGMPGSEEIHVRNGYVLSYDSTRRVPRWVAFHVTPTYRDTPKRDGRWEDFRNDPDIAGEPDEDEYNGLYYSERNYARGHMAPYAVMGGDRDGDGELAEEDDYDELTVYQFGRH